MPESVSRTEANGQATDEAKPVNRITEATADLAPNPFDPERLRLNQDFSAAVGVKKVLTVVPCRKPNRQEFVRVRPGVEWRLETGLFEDKINRENYLVERNLWQELSSEVHPACLFLTVTRQGNVFLWPCKLPGVDQRTNSWNESALAAAKHAEKRWVRVSANMPGGMYDTVEATDELSAPTWPDLSFPEILKLCFGGRFIQTLDHPVLKALRGEQ